jgi:transglutaminase/protease-like cytokinesis protein 3
MPATLHPAVASMPADAETSIASVAGYLRDREHEPRMLLKALHDYVADRVAYDGESYVAHRYPPQDAETVFKTRKAVCAGYSRLLTALGKEAGVEIVYVSGDARTRGQDLSGEGHAWNAAKIGESWYLVDATWDAGYLEGATFKKQYVTTYFMAPPHVFGVDHFPREPAWQLREPALSRGEFLRQPSMTPAFYAQGLKLVRPDRSQITANGSFELEVENPARVFLMTKGEPKMTCTSTAGATWKTHCTMSAPGKHVLELYANKEQYGWYEYVGQVEVQNAP